MKYKVVLLDTYSGYVEESFAGEMLFDKKEDAQKCAQRLNSLKNEKDDNCQKKNGNKYLEYGKGYEYVVVCM